MGGTINVPERIGWVAMTPYTGDLSGITNGDASGLIDIFRAFDVSDRIYGWGSGGNVAFNQTFANAPSVVASLATRRGIDGGWLRRGTVTTTGVRLFVDEDKYNDPERSHTFEYTSVLAFDLGGASRLHSTFVPEPSTVAVWGLLAGVFAVASRRRLLGKVSADA